MVRIEVELSLAAFVSFEIFPFILPVKLLRDLMDRMGDYGGVVGY